MSWTALPTADRVDAVSASSLDTDDIRSFNAITGNFPAEFGGRNGTIIQIQPKSGINEKTFGSFSTNHGNFRTNDVAGSFGSSFKNKFGIYISGAASRSSRFLDPVDERNFNNRGRRLNLNLRADWQPDEKDIFIFNLGINGANTRWRIRLLTWFEYAPGDAKSFDEILKILRATEEWNYVEREIDIRVQRIWGDWFFRYF